MIQQATSLENLQSADDLVKIVRVTSKQVVHNPDGTQEILKREDAHYVRPFVFREFGQVTKRFNRLMAALPEGEMDLRNPVYLALAVSHVLGSESEAIFELVGLAIKRPVEYFDTIDLDEGIRLVTALFEVNRDFFVRRVLPMVSEQVPAVTEAMSALIPQSNPTETPTPTL